MLLILLFSNEKVRIFRISAENFRIFDLKSWIDTGRTVDPGRPRAGPVHENHCFYAKNITEKLSFGKFRNFLILRLLWAKASSDGRGSFSACGPGTWYLSAKSAWNNPVRKAAE